MRLWSDSEMYVCGALTITYYWCIDERLIRSFFFEKIRVSKPCNFQLSHKRERAGNHSDLQDFTVSYHWPTMTWRTYHKYSRMLWPSVLSCMSARVTHHYINFTIKYLCPVILLAPNFPAAMSEAYSAGLKRLIVDGISSINSCLLTSDIGQLGWCSLIISMVAGRW